MSNRNWILAVGAALGLGALGGYLIANRTGEEVSESNAAVSPSQQDRRVLYWHDPMVPGAKFDKPGKSPFMDMQLVPVYADEKSGADVNINPAFTQNLGIRLGKVSRQAQAFTFDAVGNVAVDERSLRVIQARVEGYVSKLYVKAPLTRVKRGQKLADIVAPQWLAAQQEYLSLRSATSSSAAAVRDAARQRLLVLGITEQTVRMLEERGQVDTTTTLLSPEDGFVTQLSVREGAAFLPGAAIMEVTGLSKVWVNAQIPEAQVSRLGASATIDVHATAWPAQVFQAHLLALLPEVSVETRTVTARLEVDNPEHKLLPGMFVRMSVQSPLDAAALVVPTEAVITTGERSVVIVSDGGGGFNVAEVEVGAESHGQTTILSGLEEGQSIVLSGQFLIDSEASLKSAINRLTGGTERP
jgi:Cu(I)/Ag(I) efflux system membrane fusion protein